MVCETVRPEVSNKYLLAGFYGLAPHVQIAIQSFQSPVTLCFVFCGGGGTAGTYTVSLLLVDPDGLVVSNENNAPSVVGHLGDRTSTNIFMGFQGLATKPGKYRVALLVNSAEHFSTTFGLLSATGNAAPRFLNQGT